MSAGEQYRGDREDEEARHHHDCGPNGGDRDQIISSRARALHRDPRSQPSQRNGLAELDTEYPVRVGADVGARIVTEDTLRTQTVLVPALNLLPV
jgi:hypothetical protein